MTPRAGRIAAILTRLRRVAVLMIAGGGPRPCSECARRKLVSRHFLAAQALLETEELAGTQRSEARARQRRIQAWLAAMDAVTDEGEDIFVLMDELLRAEP